MMFRRKRKRFNELFSEGRSCQNVEDEAAAVVQVVDMNQNGEQQIVDGSILCSVANADPVVLSDSEINKMLAICLWNGQNPYYHSRNFEQ